MWAPGSKPRFQPAATVRGFTLLELLMVVALIAMASAGVVLAMRESGEQVLEREAQRLAAELDAARAQSRATGIPVVWRADARGFEFQGLQQVPARTIAWLEPGTTVRDSVALLLGPDPVIAPSQIELLRGERSLRIGTDGLRPFTVLPAAAQGSREREP